MDREPKLQVVPARYQARTVGAVVALSIQAGVVQSVALNPRWEWDVFARGFLTQ